MVFDLCDVVISQSHVSLTLTLVWETAAGVSGRPSLASRFRCVSGLTTTDSSANALAAAGVGTDLIRHHIDGFTTNT